MARSSRIAIFLCVGLLTLLHWQYGQSSVSQVASAPMAVPNGKQPRAHRRTADRPKRTPKETRGAKPRATSSLVRVNITPANEKQHKVTVQGRLVIRDLKTGRVLHQARWLTPCRVAVTKRGLRLEQKRLESDDVELTSQSSKGIWIGWHQYRGRVRFHRSAEGELVIVNVVPMDDYLASVINGEMPAKFPVEARKAQAVVARTYARYRMHATRGFGLFDVFADSRGQRYLGYQYRDANGRRLAGETAESRKIVRETAGLICKYKGRIFSPYYSAVCGGRTTTGVNVFGDAGPALQSVACDHCRGANRYRWTVTVSRSQLTKAIRSIIKSRGGTLQRLDSIAPVAGKRELFVVTDGRRRHTVTGRELRTALPAGTLPSPRFSLRLTGDEFVFHGRGHGHGVGLCQHGAAGLAKSGRSYAEILRYYYRGVEIAKLK